jgi:hypothetical protein
LAAVVEALGEAALFLKGLGLGCELAVQEIAAEIQQRQDGVGHEFGGRRGMTRTYTDEHGRTRTMRDRHGRGGHRGTA